MIFQPALNIIANPIQASFPARSFLLNLCHLPASWVDSCETSFFPIIAPRFVVSR